MSTSGGSAPHITRRAAGVLLHPTSLPGRGGVGDLGDGARRFLDWLGAAGQTVWQVLPLNQTGYGASPYGTISVFAGNQVLIDLEDLVRHGLLGPADLPPTPAATPHRIDHGRVERWKTEALRRAWGNFEARAEPSLKSARDEFEARETAEGWLPEWALYAALKNRYQGAPWSAWPAGLRRRSETELAAARRESRDEMSFHVFVQFLFYRQWERLHAEARRRGIRVLGDVPIYPAADSADVWAHQNLFDLDDEGRLNSRAGVPPDYFSPDGQLWGNPIYRWDRMAEDDYGWWIRRLRFLLRHFDELRLDHFRGFAGFWRVPAGAEKASRGEWAPGPGGALFEAVERALGALPLVAEDLGEITPDVIALRRRFALPGMKVLQFAFDEIDSEHLPHHHTIDSVAYTGTHDNDTAQGWYGTLHAQTRRRLEEYLGVGVGGGGGGGGGEIHWHLIRAALRSVARLAIAPAQDVLGLDRSARMNTPGATEGNWTWRLEENDLDDGAASRLRRLTELTGRLAGGASTGSREDGAGPATDPAAGGPEE